MSNIEKLNILVLHRLGDPAEAPYFLKKHIFFLQKYAPEHNYVYHDVHLPFPNILKKVEFHAVIYDVTFLCLRWFPKKVKDKILDDYSFLEETDSVKIALPQDEYDYSDILEEWLCQFNADVVYSVCPSEREVLYPNYLNRGIVKPGFTAYLDDDHMNTIEHIPFENRSIDISYRARNLPFNYGRIGYIKSKIGEMFLQHSENEDFICDISNDPRDFIKGDDWLRFVGASKFVLGSNSGSSLIDKKGDIAKCVRKYCDKHPSAEFQEVEKICFPGMDGKYEFTAVSPRVIEAAVMKAGQILVEGKYSNLLSPWEDYIPLKSDFSNKNDVFMAMKDVQAAKKMIANCYDKIIQTKALRYRNHAKELLNDINEIGQTRKISATSPDEMSKLLSEYKKIIEPVKEQCWRKLRKQKIVKQWVISHSKPLFKQIRRLYWAIND